MKSKTINAEGEEVSLLSVETENVEIKEATPNKYGSVGPPAVAQNLPADVDETIYIKGGAGLIDLVLAFHPKEESDIQTNYREIFTQKLREAGFVLEEEPASASQDGATGFVKLHAPWALLAGAAELSRLKLPFQLSDVQGNDKSCTTWPFGLPSRLRPPPSRLYFTLEFNAQRLGRFLCRDAATFFPQAARLRLAWDVAANVRLDYADIQARATMPLEGHRLGTSVGLPFLLARGVFAGAFPLHDAATECRRPTLWPLRPWLYAAWASPARTISAQPLDQIRAYFGEKVAMYFAWLGFYTRMLIPLSLLGIVVFAFGLLTFTEDAGVRDVCQGNLSRVLICRSCPYEICGFTRLKASCAAAKANAVFSNWATLVYAFLASAWGVVFLELWKREQSRLACRWDTFDLDAEYEPPRPEYLAAAGSKRKNPITGESEPHIPARSAAASFVLSVTSIAFMVAIVLALIAAVIVYKIVMVIVLYQMHSPWVKKIGYTTAAGASAGVINAVCIMIMEKIYTKIAWKLTEKELPRSDADFENSYTYKMFIFQFVNNYATLFYLAFVQVYRSSTNKEQMFS